MSNAEICKAVQFDVEWRKMMQNNVVEINIKSPVQSTIHFRNAVASAQF